MEADRGTEEKAATPYPKPPPFYKLYGQQAEPPAAVGTTSRLAPPPPPPELPPTGSYTAFGRPCDPAEPAVPPLAAPQLYAATSTAAASPSGRPHSVSEIKRELIRLNKEVMFLFVELLRVLVADPLAHTRLLTSINQVLLNMQHLANCLRPQQAADTLERALQQQINKKRRALEEVEAQMAAADRLLASAAESLEAAMERPHACTESVQRQQAMDTS